MTSVGSGLPSDGSSVTWDRDLSCWKTSPDLFGPGYPTSSPTLPSSGSMRNGVCTQRPRLAPPTNANASGSWPTPQAADGHKIGSMTPETAARQAAKGHQEMLAGAIHTASGPRAATTTPDGPNGSPKADLNPRFVEALMGVPKGWLTPSTSVETGSFQQWQQQHSSSWPDASTSTSPVPDGTNTEQDRR
jgi:hypothetical protein